MSQAVVITGASTGIGLVSAMYLDHLGLKVYAGVRKLADAETLRQASTQITPIFIDVQDWGSIQAAVAVVGEATGQAGLTGLINNAGIAVGGPLELTSVADWRRQLEINVLGQVAVTQTFLPLLRQGQGRIINMSSISGRVAMPFMGPYTSSKFALEAITDALRLEVKPWGIEVIAIEPGAIKTPIWDKSLAVADETFDTLSTEGRRLYGAALAKMLHGLRKTAAQGIPPELVAQVVAEALLAKSPKTRYLVGRDAKIAAFLAHILPDRLRDWLFVRI